MIPAPFGLSSAPLALLHFSDTLGAVGKTLGAACGVDRGFLDQNIRRGKLVTGALAAG